MLQAAEAVAEAKRELVAVFEAMPRDLQQTMLSAPRRADLLHSLGAHTKVPPEPKDALARCSADRCTVGQQMCATFPHSLCAIPMCSTTVTCPLQLHSCVGM
jgi:hypothetical protein